MSKEIVPHELIESKILVLRAHKVLLDRDLALLYGIETKVLNQAVSRNIARFPADFMFQLTPAEIKNWKSQFVTSNSRLKMGLRKRSHAFMRIPEQTGRHSASKSATIPEPNRPPFR